MSEIICFYNYADNDKESGCFILESNVELNDFKEFLVQSNIMEESQILLDTDNKPIESEEAFTTMKDDAVVNNTTLSFIIASPAPEPALPAPVEEEKKAEEPFGPLIKQLLSTFNINNLSNITQLNDIIDCIPFPFSMMARGYLANIRANPNAIEQIVQSLAPAYSAQAAPLIAEVTRAFDFFDRKESEKQEEQLRLQREEEEAREAELARQERAQREREAQLERDQQQQQQQQKSQPEVKEREFIGPIMQQLLEKVGVELNITAADISMLVRYIPSNYRGLVLRVVRELAANVFYVNYAIRYVAQLLNVSENALVREVHHAFNCFRRAVSSLKVEESKEQVKHQAICDNCQTFITGIRYKCLHCPDYDLCNKCEEENSDFHFHDETHVFAKIINPSQSLPASRGGHRMSGCHPHMRARHNRIASLEASVEELKKAVAALSENKL